MDRYKGVFDTHKIEGFYFYTNKIKLKQCFAYTCNTLFLFDSANFGAKH